MQSVLPSARAKDLEMRVAAFVANLVRPAEAVFPQQLSAVTNRWSIPPIMKELKTQAKAEGLWNLFLPEHDRGAALTNLEHAPVCEIIKQSPIAPEAFTCAAPDMGNMEVLARYGTAAQKKEWLQPLLAGEIRSCFGMTEPDVASSDATIIKCAIRAEGHQYVVAGRKWWTSGALDPRCKTPTPRRACFASRTNPSRFTSNRSRDKS